MPQLNDIHSKTSLEDELGDLLQEPGITPVSYYGNFTGVLICVGDKTSDQAANLYDFLKRNHPAAIDELRKLAAEH